MFTSILNDRLKQYSEDNYLLNETQAGFRQEYSTLDHMFLFKYIIDLFKWKKRKLYCLFVAYKKAVDNVWREWLGWKFVSDNDNGKFLKVVHDIKSCVMVDQEMSDTFTCNMCVREERICRLCCLLSL